MLSIAFPAQVSATSSQAITSKPVAVTTGTRVATVSLSGIFPWLTSVDGLGCFCRLFSPRAYTPDREKLSSLASWFGSAVAKSS